MYYQGNRVLLRFITDCVRSTAREWNNLTRARHRIDRILVECQREYLSLPAKNVLRTLLSSCARCLWHSTT
jgi:hypothetical protein